MRRAYDPALALKEMDVSARLYSREDSIMSGRFTVTKRIFCQKKKRDAEKKDDASKEIEKIKMDVNTYLLLVGIRAPLGPKYFRVLNHGG